MRFLIGTSLILALGSLILSLSGCAHAGPDLHGKLWAGASKADGIQRAQDGAIMKCSEPPMDQMVCLKYDDLKAYKASCREYY